MGPTITLAALGAVAFMALDGVRRGLLVKHVAWAACGAVVRSAAR